MRPPLQTRGSGRVTTDEDVEFVCYASRGDRIELIDARLGVHVRGTVFYADQLQLLVKWDDGRSESIRRGTLFFRIVGDDAQAA